MFPMNNFLYKAKQSELFTFLYSQNKSQENSSWMSDSSLLDSHRVRVHLYYLKVSFYYFTMLLFSIVLLGVPLLQPRLHGKAYMPVFFFFSSFFLWSLIIYHYQLSERYLSQMLSWLTIIWLIPWGLVCLLDVLIFSFLIPPWRWPLTSRVTRPSLSQKCNW